MKDIFQQRSIANFLQMIIKAGVSRTSKNLIESEKFIYAAHGDLLIKNLKSDQRPSFILQHNTIYYKRT
jgi:hypothetical protein